MKVEELTNLIDWEEINTYPMSYDEPTYKAQSLEILADILTEAEKNPTVALSYFGIQGILEKKGDKYDVKLLHPANEDWKPREIFNSITPLYALVFDNASYKHYKMIKMAKYTLKAFNLGVDIEVVEGMWRDYLKTVEEDA